MILYELFIQPIFIGIFCIIMASVIFWAEKKPKSVPADGMQVLNDTHTLVEAGNYQVNNRLGRLESRMTNIENKLDLLVKLQTKP